MSRTAQPGALGPPVLQAVARAAAELTQAAGATVLAVRDDELVVLATAGPEPGRAVGERLERGDGALAYALAAGQSLAVSPARPRPGEGAPTAATDEPVATMCVPCLGTDGVIGALELRGTPMGEPFDVSAGRIAEALAVIAAAELEEDPGTRAVPSPSELAAELDRLSADDAPRYSAIASALAALLAAAERPLDPGAARGTG